MKINSANNRRSASNAFGIFRNTILITFLLAIFPLGSFAQDLAKKEAKSLMVNGVEAQVLDKTLWIRLKPRVNYSKFCGIYPQYKITPLIPQQVQEDRYFKRGNILSDRDEIGDKISRMYLLEYEADMPMDKFMAKLLSENPEIESIEPYYIYDLQKSPEEPDDALYSEQTSLSLIKAKEAFKNGLTGSPNTIIAISDAGVDVSHEDLKDNIAYNTAEIPNDGIDNDNNGYIDDYAGYNFAYKEENTKPDNVKNSSIEHGTIVASIASATTNNGKGIAGTGNQCRYFPLKIVSNGKVVYGYQSITYAAVRGFSVLNCSWGRANKLPFSQFEQDIIDFAVSRNVAIVAASGNRGDNIGPEDVYYPANYNGVLGVGATDLNRIATNSVTTVSLQTKILAPGLNKSTNGYTYSHSDAATSFSTPVISGFLGLIRSKYPELNAREAVEFARVCVDDARSVNPSTSFFLPGFVNFMKALQVPPSQAVSLQPKQITLMDNSGNAIDRVSQNTEINVKILAHSYFADADNLRFKFEFNGTPNSIKLIKSDIKIDHIKGKSDFEINGFKFIVLGDQPDFAAFRVNIYKDGKYIDYFTFPVYFNVDVANFSNKAMSFSVSDYGKLGFSMKRTFPNHGLGWTIKGSPTFLTRRSGLSLIFNNANVFTGASERSAINYDFTPLKRLTGEDRHISIVSLNNNPDNIVSLISKYSFVDDSLPIVRIDFELINNGENYLDKPALGLLFDWDMPPNSSENTTEYFPKGIPADANVIKTAAQIISNSDRTKNIATLVWSEENTAIAQSAGIQYKTYGDDANNLIPIFSNGTKEQTDLAGDIMSASGMRFNTTMQKDGRGKFTMIIAYGENEEEVASRLKYGYKVASSVIEYPTIACEIYPNPASDRINIKFKDEHFGQIEIYNLLGDVVQTSNISGDNFTQIDFQSLPRGRYFILLGERLLGAFVK